MAISGLGVPGGWVSLASSLHHFVRKIKVFSAPLSSSLAPLLPAEGNLRCASLDVSENGDVMMTILYEYVIRVISDI